MIYYIGRFSSFGDEQVVLFDNAKWIFSWNKVDKFSLIKIRKDLTHLVSSTPTDYKVHAYEDFISEIKKS